ncbi:hypothetical protein ACFL29_00145 [Patescibacteria group bacterium]
MVIRERGIKGIKHTFVLMLLEFALAIISLPLYLGMSPSKTTVFLEDKGGYEKIAVDYSLRRVLTLTGVGIILIFWIIKLVFFMLMPIFYGPQELYTITQKELLGATEEIIVEETGVHTAKISEDLPVPKIGEIFKSGINKYVFSGTGEAGESVILFLTDQQTVMYSDKVENDKTWKIEHLQSEFKLTEGQHSIFVFHYNKDDNTRSRTSLEKVFEVRMSFLEKAFQRIDDIANWGIIFIIIAGVFIMILTI